MMATLGLLMWGYFVARLLQIPVEYKGESIKGRAWLIITSGIGILIATYALYTLPA